MGLVLAFGLSVTFFTIILLTRKLREVKDRSHYFGILILGLWLLRFSLWFLKHEVDLSEVPWLFFIDQNLFFLDGVFLLWHTKSLNNWQFSLKKEVFHFIPFLLSCAITLKPFLFFSKDELNLVYQMAISEIETQAMTLSVEEVAIVLGTIIHTVIYCFLSLGRIWFYQKNLKALYSTIDTFQVTWIPKFLFIWLTLIVVPLVIYFFNYLVQIVDVVLLESFLLISFVSASSYFCFYSVNQSYASTILTEQLVKRKFDQSELLKLELVYKKLQDYMESDKPYLKEGLTLMELSEFVGLTSIEVSTAIKECANSNFYNYINGFRVEAIKKELVSSEEQIIILAYNNGFKSKSTFNKVFREHTGFAPSEYRKKYKVQ